MRCGQIKASDFRHQINIERETQVKDSVGGVSSSWLNFLTVWASVKPATTNERTQAARLESNISHKIITRYTTDITPKDRINFNGRIMNIKSVINIDEDSQFLEIKALEGVAT